MKLLFVYNAKSDKVSKTIDFVHKILSPKTYACDLCSLTHHSVGEKEAWKNYRENGNFDMEFLYKDEFEKKYFKTEYPAVFKVENEELEVIISPGKFRAINSLYQLIQHLENFREK